MTSPNNKLPVGALATELRQRISDKLHQAITTGSGSRHEVPA